MKVGQVFKKQWDDFSPIPNNHRAQDFDRKWNHTRAKVSVQSLEDIPEDVSRSGLFRRRTGDLKHKIQCILEFAHR